MSARTDDSGIMDSTNDSIPLDDAESSMSVYSEEPRRRYAARDDDDNILSDEYSDEISETTRGSLDYSSVSRTYESRSQSRGRKVPPRSEDYTGTASYYLSGGGASHTLDNDEQDYDYSSGSGSLSYRESPLWSPRSDFSATFASMYYENRFVVRARATLHFLRRPLYYLAFVTAGSSLVGSVCRLATTVVTQQLDGNAGADFYAGWEGAGSTTATAGASAEGMARVRLSGGGGVSSSGGLSLPPGYPMVPSWMQEMRASLPSIVEVPATWLLRAHSIPVLSEVLEHETHFASAPPSPSFSTSSANAAATSSSFAATTSAATAAATAFTGQVGSRVQEAWHRWQKQGPSIPVALFLPLFSLVAIKVARQVRPSAHDFTEQLRRRQEAEDADGATSYFSYNSPAGQMSPDASPIPQAQASLVDTSGPSALPGPAPARTSGHVTASSRSAASDRNLDTPPTPPLRVPPVRLAGALGSSALPPLTPKDDPLQGDTAPSASGAEAMQNLSKLARATTASLRGDVVAAITGAVEMAVANDGIQAAVRYGCSAVLLPATVKGTPGLMEAPPSLQVMYVPSVMVAAKETARRRGSTLVGVTLHQYEEDAQLLATYAHPMNVVYVLVSHELADASAVEAMGEAVSTCVYLNTDQKELPANELFYDRLLKERPSAPPSSAVSQTA